LHSRGDCTNLPVVTTAPTPSYLTPPSKWMARGPALRTYRTAIIAVSAKRLHLPVPFDPDAAWGAKPVHHVRGMIGAIPFRGPIEACRDGWVVNIGHVWRRGAEVDAGVAVDVSIEPEGPQRSDLPADIAAAFEADPQAGAFFDGLAQFYRKAYLKWADVRKPEVRAERITELVRLLKAGHKARPKAG